MQVITGSGYKFLNCELLGPVYRARSILISFCNETFSPFCSVVLNHYGPINVAGIIDFFGHVNACSKQPLALFMPIRFPFNTHSPVSESRHCQLCKLFRANSTVESTVDVSFSGLFGSGFGCFGLGLRVVSRNNNSTYEGIFIAQIHEQP